MKPLARVTGRPVPVAVVGLIAVLVATVLSALRLHAEPLLNAPFRGYATGRRPLDIAQGDLNRDGAPDLVVANFGSGSVSVLLNTGAGEFHGRVDVATGPRPRGLALADLDGDGRLEILVADNEEDVVRIYRWVDGDAAELWQTLATPDGPSALMVHAFRPGARPDILVACADAALLCLYPSQAEEGFTVRVDYSTVAGARFLARGDLVGDALEDVVVGGDPGNVHLFSGIPGGQFRSHDQPATGIEELRGVTVVDMTGDGLADIVVGGRDGVQVMPQEADRVYRPTRIVTAPSVRWVGVADMNGDGRRDILLNDGPTPYGRVVVHTREANGSFRAAWSGLAGGFPYSGVLADFDGDRRLDLVLANSTSHNVSVLTKLMQSQPGEQSMDVGSYPQHMNTADWNRDGLPDLLVHTIFPGSHSEPGGSSAVYRVERSGSGFTRGVAFSQSCCLDNFLAADVSGDNVADILYLQSTARDLFVRITGSAAGVTTTRRLVIGGAQSPVAVGDFDDDGHADILFQNISSKGIGVLRGLGGREFERGADIPLPGPVGQMLPGDFNGDGWPDLAVSYSNGQSNVVSILRNVHAEALRPILVGPSLAPMAVGDFDGNGTLDLTSTSGLTYLGYGDFTFRSVIDPFVLESNAPSREEIVRNPDGSPPLGTASREVAARSNTVAAGDFNGDGFDDIAFMGYGYNSIHVRLSLDGGRFGPPMEYGTGRLPLSLAAGDFNVDGRDDVATVTYESGLVILVNTGAAVVPISWLNSRLARVADGGVMLSWDVPADARASAFSVLRSVDGGERGRLTPRPMSGLARYEFLDAAPPAGRLRYWIEELTRTGALETHGPFELEEGTAAPGARPVLHAAHPNPFRGATSLSFTLAEGGAAALSVHDVAGRRVATLLDGTLSPGQHAATWDGADEAGVPLPSGLYFLRLETAHGTVTRKVVRAR